jgi:DNA-binding SARP family transcriptional activator
VDSPGLRIRVFGELDLRHGEDALPAPESARAESLLAYLILHRDAPAPRERLAFLLWPDSTERQARTNLRHVLHNLRRALPDPDRFLDVTQRTLQWRAGTPCWVDLAAFEDALARAGKETDDVAALRDAVDIYTGDLLEGSYDEWLLSHRERLRQRYLDALERLAGLFEARGDRARAIAYAERLLVHDPLHEGTYRLLIRLYDARGDRARALRTYHACIAALDTELGVEPSAATREAYEALFLADRTPDAGQIRGGRVGGPPLVGRAAERSLLTALWRATENGRAQLVLVTGEPGVGKTRLVEELQSWCAHRGALIAAARSYPAEGALAYGPIVSWLRSETLKPRLLRLGKARISELARLLPELLHEVPGLPQPELLTPSDQRQRLFDAIAAVVLGSGRPLLLVADDVHWWDRESLQVLHYLLRVQPAARLLVAATSRREEVDDQHPLNELVAGLHQLERIADIPLDRFTRAETVTLAEQLAGAQLAEAAADELFRETEGNPLFVVEAVRAGRLSPKVQAVIESRLARLSEPAGELVRVAATIGREFTTDVLAAASEADADTLVRGLDELWRRRIVRERDADAYDFSHDKIREVAYQGMSPAQRRHRHLHVARALERVHAHQLGRVSGQLATHYESAGAVADAVGWYARAAEAAQELHANVEAIRLLRRALDLIARMPDGAERQARELEIRTALLPPLGAVEGFASGWLSENHERALDLARTIGVDPDPPLLRSVAIARLSAGDFEEARRFGEQLRARGERDGDDVLVVEGEYVLGIAAFWQAEFEAARTHFEAAVDRYRAEHRGTHLVRYILDPQVVCLSRLGNTWWFLGRPAEAVRARDAALALAEEIGHPQSLGTALVFAALLAIDMREPERVRAYTASLNDGLEQQWRPTQASAAALNGFVDVLDGRVSAGMARIQRVLDDPGAGEHAPGMGGAVVRILLEACAIAGDARTGLAAADRALGMGGTARVWEAEARRLRTEFLAALAGQTLPERSRNAIS